jgi:hypothetical protein
MAKETAEEKLLKALQKKAGTPSAPTTKKNSPFKFSFSIFDLNKILIVAIIICGLFLVWQLRKGMALVHQELTLTDDNKTSLRSEGPVLPQVKDAKYYIDSFGNRNIFRPYDISLGQAAQAQPNLAKRLSKYKLVGVSWLDLPETATVMIEDTQTKTTRFLKTGEQLEGVTIKTIYTDRVVLSYENEETTIKL